MTDQGPPQAIIDGALRVADFSPCRSKRGVVLYTPSYYADDPVESVVGRGFNGPPDNVCPGRSICAGTCGQRSVHAEMRALRSVPRRDRVDGELELVHVERGADGKVVPCAGPSCWQCSREILDVGFVAGVWLYEGEPLEAYAARLTDDPGFVLSQPAPAPPRWRRYTAADFHRATLVACGMVP